MMKQVRDCERLKSCGKKGNEKIYKVGGILRLGRTREYICIKCHIQF